MPVSAPRPAVALHELRFLARAASAGVSPGSKLTTTTSNSLPAVNDIACSEPTSPLSTCVQSIGHS